MLTGSHHINFRIAGDSGILLLDALKSLIYEATVPRQEK